MTDLADDPKHASAGPTRERLGGLTREIAREHFECPFCFALPREPCRKKTTHAEVDGVHQSRWECANDLIRRIRGAS